MVAGSAGPANGADETGRWEVTRPPQTPRTADHSATLLADGKVLVVGGLGPGEFSAKAMATPELFDPSTERWSKTDPLATPARQYHRATRLSDSTVLVTGGIIEGKFPVEAEVFRPDTGTWKAVASMARGRIGHTATLLSDGTVLVAGGVVAGEETPTAFTDSVELFNPSTGIWSELPPMPTLRAEHTATLLGDGTVLVAGGHDGPQTPALRDTLIFDAKAAAWRTVPHLLATGRAAHTATSLADGTVLMVGGSKARDHGGGGQPLRSTEIYDPAAQAWHPGPSLAHGRLGHAATELKDGRVLVVGGLSERKEGVPQPVKSAEVYDPTKKRWSLTPTPPSAPTSRRDRVMRVFLLAGHPTATLLTGSGCTPNCGQVLTIGGDTASTEAQLFNPGEPGGSSGATALALTGLVAMIVLSGGVVVARRRRRQFSPQP